MDSTNLLLVIFLIGMLGFSFYTNKKRKAAQRVLETNIKPGAKVVLYSGIIGTLEVVDEKSALVRTGSSTIEVARGSIRNAEPGPVKPAIKVSSKPAAKSAARKAPAKVATSRKPAAKKPSSK